MLSQILHYLAVWRWSDVHQEPISAIDACIGAVEIYFPCSPTAGNQDSQCLCEQYVWRASCFYNHNVEISPSCGHRNITEDDRDNYCKAAGSVGAELAKRNFELEHVKRQPALSSLASIVSSVAVNSTILRSSVIGTATGGVISSLQGAISSVLASAAPTRTAGVVTSAAANPPAVSTVPAVLSSAIVPTPTGFKSSAVINPTTAPGLQSIASSQTSTLSTALAPSTATTGPTPPPPHGPSAGLIAGAVLGSIAVLVLLGILIMLILRHRKKSKAETPAASGGELGGNEKEVYYGKTQPGPYGPNELPGHVHNVWELEGTGPAPREMEAANNWYGLSNPKPAYMPPGT